MNWRDLFNLEHEHAHTAKLDEPAEFQDLVLRGRTDEELFDPPDLTNLGWHTP
jgi:hypothetical protein